MVISTIARGASANPAHAVTVALAIILMVVHAVWATVVLVRENREAIARFHRFSAGVWTIWLIPYFCGLLMGVPAIDLSPNAAFGAALGAAGAIGLVLHLRGNARGIAGGSAAAPASEHRDPWTATATGARQPHRPLPLHSAPAPPPEQGRGRGPRAIRRRPGATVACPLWGRTGHTIYTKKGATMPTTARSAEIKTRPTAQIKADASKVYPHWGISLSDAINIFLTKSIEVGGLPFDMRPSVPSFDGLEHYAFHPRLDPNRVATLPEDWDEDE